MKLIRTEEKEKYNIKTSAYVIVAVIFEKTQTLFKKWICVIELFIQIQFQTEFNRFRTFFLHESSQLYVILGARRLKFWKMLMKSSSS